MTYRKLSAEEEVELFSRMPETRQFLIENNLPMALNIAKRYAEVGIYDLEDAFQDACLFLIRAIDTFDKTRGFRLSTYAWCVIWRELYKKRKQECKHFHSELPEVFTEDKVKDTVNLRCLTVQERRVIKAHYFMFMSYRDIGAVEGISKQRVQQIHDAAITKLRSKNENVSTNSHRSGP